MHQPVLLKEVLEVFNPKPGQIYIDMTVNGGGHARAIAEKIGPRGKVFGIDWDCELLKNSTVRASDFKFQDRVTLICDNYANIKSIVKKYAIPSANGILFDLGFSSHHIEHSRRGFSFQRDEPLDMRYSPASHALTAEKIINEDPRNTIENIIRDLGGERFAGRIANAIVRARRRKRIATSAVLADIIFQSVPAPYRHGRIHPATRTFQALRIAVNHELENLRRGLEDAVPYLAPGGILAVLSFHSLEERIIKSFFKEKSDMHTMQTITPKPISASDKERESNLRARSAHLRAARKII